MLRRSVLMGGMAMVLIAPVASAQQPRGPGRGGFGGPGGFPGSPAMLLGVPEVQKEIGLSDEQKKQVEKLVSDLQEEMRASFGNFNFQEIQNLSQEEREKRFDEARKKAEETSKKTDEKLGKILEAKQAERLNQLRLQREGVGAFNRAEIAKQIGLTEDQRDKIRKIQEEARPQGGGGFANLQNLSDEERRDLFAKMQERREQAQKEILDVLTDDQQAKWTEMKGKEFKFPEQRAGFGGFGGPGQGGRGNEERKRPEKKKEN